MNKKTISLGILSFLLLSVVSATCVDYFYSPGCPHCEKVTPIVKDMKEKYPDTKITFYDVTKGSYNIKATPTVIVTTSDGREIKLVGSRDIPNHLECELQEMTTKECPTKPAGTKIGNDESWFIRE